MSALPFDHQDWLDRIGHTGSVQPTLDTLHKLIFAHSHTIAYESLDIMLGKTPKLDLASLQRKMIAGGRGGYCLEQNMLFREGQRSLGYNITSLQGRVVRGMAIDAPRPAIHMLLQVNLPEGPYLADVGFGNLAHFLQYTVPLKQMRSQNQAELVERKERGSIAASNKGENAPRDLG